MTTVCVCVCEREHVLALLKFVLHIMHLAEPGRHIHHVTASRHGVTSGVTSRRHVTASRHGVTASRH